MTDEQWERLEPFVNISATFPADPGDPHTPKSSFRSTDPFAIVTRVQASADLVQAGARYDATFWAENPHIDWFGRSWWIYRVVTDEMFLSPTKDAYIDNVPLQWTHFIVWVEWDSYQNFIHPRRGLEVWNGVFFVRGTINVRGTNLFAVSENFAYKVEP